MQSRNSHQTVQKLNPLFDLEKVCRMVGIPDIITPANFGDVRLRGMGIAEDQISPSPIGFRGCPYKTLALPCQCAIYVRISILPSSLCCQEWSCIISKLLQILYCVTIFVLIWKPIAMKCGHVTTDWTLQPETFINNKFFTFNKDFHNYETIGLKQIYTCINPALCLDLEQLNTK